MKSAINKRVSEYRGKIADCDELLNVSRFKKEGLRDKNRDEKETEKAFALTQLSMIKKEEAIIEAKRQCCVQAMHDFDSLLDEL